MLLTPLLTLSAQETMVISDDKLIIADVIIEGNQVTKPSIILRELVFEKGDTILKMELLPSFQRSKENLLNLAIFNFVLFDATHLPGNRIHVIIRVTERWYIWPVPILEYADRNFNTFIRNRDWQKINYGAYLKWNNFRGRKELLTAKIRLGYVNQYALSYDIPNIGKEQKHGITTGFHMNTQNEVYVATVNNQTVEYEPLDKPAQTRYNAFAKYVYRRKLYTKHSLRLDYFDYLVSDSVAIVNPHYLGESRDRYQFFMVSYHFNHDVRDSRIYPLEGFAVTLRAEQLGLGMMPENPYSSLRLTGVLMFHQKLANRVYFYNVTKAKYSTEKVMPYALNRGLGYNEFMSGYESYVIDGSDYVIMKYSMKFQLIKPSTYTLPLIGMEQFSKVHYAVYVNLFADAGYVNNDFPDPTNNMVNSWQFSAGIGIDFVTYYDQVFRIDYAINKYGERGFFVHVETPFFRW
jgi:outer membrane protein assembly factor BamA